jgi:hypothetical protein
MCLSLASRQQEIDTQTQLADVAVSRRTAMRDPPRFHDMKTFKR